MDLRGVYPALLSPFKADGTFDFETLRALVRFQSDKGVHGFYAGGTSSELFSLSLDERKKTMEIVRETAPDKALIVHVGAMNPEDAKELARHAAASGAHAISAIPPFYCKYTWPETAAYYRSLMDASGLKMFLYNIPAFTGVSLAVAQYAELVETGGVAGLKHTSYNLYEMDRLKAVYPEGIVLAGHDEVLCGALAMGAQGCIGTSVNAFPEYYLKIAAYMREERLQAAQKVQSEVNALLQAFMESENFFAATKHIVTLRGIPVGECRPPFQPLSAEKKQRLAAAYRRCEENMAKL